MSLYQIVKTQNELDAAPPRVIKAQADRQRREINTLRGSTSAALVTVNSDVSNIKKTA